MSEGWKLFRRMLREPPSVTPFDLDTWLIEAARSELGKAGSLAEAYAVSNSQRVWNAFGKYNDQLIKQGRFEAFQVVDTSKRLLTTQPPAKTATAVKMRLRASLIRWMDGLTSREFEFVGGLAALSMNASHTFVSRGSGDGGVDFYATIPAMGPSDILHGTRRELRVVGQSKKYASPAGVEKLRDFSDVLDSVRKRAASIDSKIPPWFHSHRGPIVGWIIASSGVQSGFSDLCRERGIIISDESDIAEHFLRSKSIPIQSTEPFISKEFSARLDDLKAKNDERWLDPV